jgi:glyoxylase-like metal-dependent hydrolase (beta-lactamase superfamily II)/rhodanese-related sulfurtransferase
LENKVPLNVVILDTPTLGDRGYIAHDGKTALVVDPQRDIDRVEQVLTENNLNLGAVVETHMHNDYVSGGLVLAQKYEALYITSAEDPVAFKRTAAHDLDEFAIGNFGIKALRTPGHTFTHLSYLLSDESGNAQGIFTGGSLLHGSTGRPDLLGDSHAAELARLQHGSAHRISDLLDGSVPIYPTHGFGSFCAATSTSGTASTIKDEKLTNPALLLPVEQFISQTLAGLDNFPAYYKHMGPRNLAGAGPIDLSELPRLSSQELLKVIASDAWVVDLRDKDIWAKGHLAGTINFGISGSFATYLGWLFPYEKEIVLISDQEQQISLAQRELVRIGIDRPKASFVGDVNTVGETMPTSLVHFKDVPAVLSDPQILVLDVRRNSEREASHIAGSSHIPLHELSDRMAELPKEKTIWVHCAGAYRASIAASLIQNAGFNVVLINEPYEKVFSVPELPLVTGSSDQGPVAPSDLKKSEG